MDRTQLTLLDLFGLVAFCAVVALCLSFVGVDNEVFWLVLLVGAVQSAIVVCLARIQRLKHFAYFAAILSLVLPCMLFMSLSLLTNTFLLVVLAFECARRPTVSLRRLTQFALVFGAVSLLAGLAPGIAAQQRIDQSRHDFPFVSLDSRLDYEDRPLPVSHVDPELGVVPDLSLAESEKERRRWTARASVLNRLHDEEYKRFVAAEGFGVSRTSGLRLRLLDFNPIRDIGFDEIRGTARSVTSNPPSVTSRDGPLDQFHTSSRKQFLDAEFFGLIAKARVQVAGFVEHAFHFSPMLRVDDPIAWRLERLELVSLLKFSEPRVYVLDHLPRMDQLSSLTAPTRPLDAFEEESLKRLRNEEDVVIAEESDHFRMLGSLRAAEQCLQCHNVRRGELLGAFSYKLSRN